jgi:hypothetical protein
MIAVRIKTSPIPPYSESDITTSGMAPQVNGEAPSSAFLSVSHTLNPITYSRMISYHNISESTYLNRPTLISLQHLYSYPVISDSISTFKSNPYGAKSLSLTTTSYEKISKPLLPYLHTPYTYISPYIAKADTIGDSTLSTLDSKFPAVKKPTGELYDNGKSIVFFPLKKGTEGKEYVVGVWGGECEKVGGEGLVTYSKAAIATGLIVGSDVVGWLSGFLSQKKAEVKEVTNEKTG